MFTKVSAILMAMITGALLTGCGNRSSSESNVEEVENCDSLPTTIKLLVRAVADNDSIGFARLVTYPIQRPYPLHDIDSAGQMKSYYKEMVDDSLRDIIVKAAPRRWKEYGWRGWSLDDGQYIWIDEGIYDVRYISQKEIKKLDSLTDEEIRSIEPSIREGWFPVLCLRNDGNGNIYRVDSNFRGHNHHKEGKHYRMAVYGPANDLRGLPAQLLEGVLENGGSANTVIYRFVVRPGEELLLEPESPETGSPVLIEHNDSVVPLRRAYWHELVNTPK